LTLKFFLLIASSLLFLESAFSQGKAEKSVDLFVSLMKGLPRPKNVSRGQSLDPDLKLTIVNNTDTIATFHKTWNLWGDDAIRLELTIKDSIYNLYYSSFCSSNNFPDPAILRPSDSMIIYLKVEECYQNGPCPCTYSLPNRYRFPANNLRGAQLRAFYMVNLENHQQYIDFTMEDAKWLNSTSHKAGKIIAETEKYLKSFVTCELVSKSIRIDFDSW
jgi:hypothetical protein